VILRLLLLVSIWAGTLGSTHAEDAFVIKPSNTLKAAEANQAAAADGQYVYAIDSAVIGQYDRATGQRIAVSSGPAKHLNSGFLWNGRLYCAHSNFPTKPEHSEIIVLDPQTMVLSSFKDFGASDGSLTWVVREGDFWWCTFAFYGVDNAKTTLVKFDAAWCELGRWTYPPAVIADLGKMSISGGVWQNTDLLATGHDKRVIYRLRLPIEGHVLQLIETIPSPFPGQGIALDPKTGGLIGIDRKQREVIFATLEIHH